MQCSHARCDKLPIEWNRIGLTFGVHSCQIRQAGSGGGPVKGIWVAWAESGLAHRAAGGNAISLAAARVCHHHHRCIVHAPGREGPSGSIQAFDSLHLTAAACVHPTHCPSRRTAAVKLAAHGISISNGCVQVAVLLHEGNRTVDINNNSPVHPALLPHQAVDLSQLTGAGQAWNGAHMSMSHALIELCMTGCAAARHERQAAGAHAAHDTRRLREGGTVGRSFRRAAVHIPARGDCHGLCPVQCGCVEHAAGRDTEKRRQCASREWCQFWGRGIFAHQSRLGACVYGSWAAAHHGCVAHLSG